MVGDDFDESNRGGHTGFGAAYATRHDAPSQFDFYSDLADLSTDRPQR